MGTRRLLLAVEAVVLLASLACATAESGYITDQSEVVLLQEHENSPDVMGSAKAQVAKLALKARREEMQAAHTTILEEQKKLVVARATMTKLQAQAASDAARLSQMKDPVVNATMPAAPAVVAGEADKLATVQLRIAATKKEVDDGARLLKRAQSTVVAAEEAADKAKVKAIREAEEAKVAKIMKDAKVKADALAAAKKQRDATIQAEKERKEALLSSAETGVLNAQAKQNTVVIGDKSKINQLTVRAQDSVTRIAAAKQTIQEALIEDRASKFQLVLKEHTLHMAQQLEAEAQRTKSALELQSTNADGDRKRGLVLMGQAKEALEVNADRIIHARGAAERAHNALRDAEHSKRMDENHVKSAQETIDEMKAETDKLEKKKELVAAFGATLRTKAERDASVAKSGLAKAQGDHENAALQYAKATKEVARQQRKIDKDEALRQETVKAVLTALEEDNGAAAMQSGERHEEIDRMIRRLQKKKTKLDMEAQVHLTAMTAAKKEEESALSLQVAANEQFNQAKNNDEALASQQSQLNSLYAEQSQRKQASQAVLAKARAAVQQAQTNYDTEQKIYEARVAAERYLKDVKMPVAQKLIDGASDILVDSKGAAGVDSTDIAQDEISVETATKAVDSAKAKVKKAHLAVIQAKQDAGTLKKQAAILKKNLEASKLKLEADTTSSKINVEKAEMRLHDVRHPIQTDMMDSAAIDGELKSKLEAASAARATVDESTEKLVTQTASAKSSKDKKKKEDLSAAKKSHKAEVEKMNKANDAVEKAKAMYHKAFGASISVPGHREHLAARAKTEAKASAAVTAASAP